MSKSSYKSFSTAEQLPDYWDDIAGDNIFLRKNYLKVLEKANPCGQVYTIFFCPEPDSILLTYKLSLDIFTYSLARLKLPMTIAGIPCSVSKGGYVKGKETEAQLFEYLRQIKGAKLLLNSEDDFKAAGFAKGYTLPSCRLEIRWNSFDDYLSEMRSHYRYRMNKAIQRFCEIKEVTLNDNCLFDNKLYDLYTDVYKKSEYKLEKLTIDFFREFPSTILSFYLGTKPVAFVQLIENSQELIFLFGGVDYSLNLKYDIYWNMLLSIIRYGIEKGFKVIEMGQTAEDTKMKLGCKIYEKFLYANHSVGLINYFVHKGIGLLSYRRKDQSFNVFREGI